MVLSDSLEWGVGPLHLYPCCHLIYEGGGTRGLPYEALLERQRVNSNLGQSLFCIRISSRLSGLGKFNKMSAQILRACLDRPDLTRNRIGKIIIIMVRNIQVLFFSVEFLIKRRGGVGRFNYLIKLRKRQNEVIFTNIVECFAH